MANGINSENIHQHVADYCQLVSLLLYCNRVEDVENVIFSDFGLHTSFSVIDSCLTEKLIPVPYNGRKKIIHFNFRIVRNRLKMASDPFTFFKYAALDKY